MVIRSEVRDEKFAALNVKGVGVLVRAGGFVWFEAFDGSVNLGVSDILEGRARRGVVEEGVNVIIIGGEEKKLL